MAPIADKIDLYERFNVLDSFQLVRRGGVGMLKRLSGESTRELTAKELKPLESVDWEPALRSANQWYDRMAEATRIKNRVDRERELDKIDKELHVVETDSMGPFKLAKLAFGQDPPEIAVGKAIGDKIIALQMPGTREMSKPYDRAEQVRRNLHVAFALVAFHADNGRYPEKLADLAPMYLPAVPDDLFSGKALIYKPTDKGYLFYSVGPNGKDDEGRWTDDDPPGDDIAVRMPLPERKRKK
jgi:hypothetical protein